VATPFAFDREWHFQASPDDLWRTLARIDRYRTWWPWLRELEVDVADDVDDADPLVDGTVADFVIQAPLPYQLRGTIAVVHAACPHVLEAVVTGDLEGPARLELVADEDGAGATARLVWSLEVRSNLLRPLASIARPALSWAHDRIVERGLVQFETYALAEWPTLE
jgi:hypothetical protein